MKTSQVFRLFFDTGFCYWTLATQATFKDVLMAVYMTKALQTKCKTCFGGQLNIETALFVLLLSELQSNFLPGCIIEQDTDFYGNDIINEETETSEACADFCASTSGGLFWTWDPENGR